MAIVPKSDSTRIQKLATLRMAAIKAAEAGKGEIEKLLASSLLIFIQKTQWSYLVTSATRIAITPIDAGDLKQLRLFHTYVKRLHIFDYNSRISVEDVSIRVNETSLEVETSSEDSAITLDRIFRDEALTSQIRNLETQADSRIEAQREFSRLSHRRVF